MQQYLINLSNTTLILLLYILTISKIYINSISKGENKMILRNIGVILTILVGIEHIGIMWLEIFGKPELQAKSFDMDINFVKQPAAKTALANQGIYNGMLGLLILIVFFFFKIPTLITVWQLLLAFVIVVAIFGGFTASKKIFVVQMLPALIAFILLFF